MGEWGEFYKSIPPAPLNKGGNRVPQFIGGLREISNLGKKVHEKSPLLRGI